MATNPQSFEHYEVKETGDLFLAINEVNAMLSRLGERIDELAGLRGDAKFYGTIDAGGNRLTNVAPPVGADDAETAKHSLRSSSDTSPFDAGGKPVSNVGRAINDHDAVPLGQMREEAELAVTVDITPPNAAIVSLTDSTTGTADNTLAAIPNPTDTPASADALRDDLTTNIWPVLRNNFADLASKMNTMLVAMRDHGIITP